MNPVFPKAPKITGDASLSDEERRDILGWLLLDGHVSAYRVFTVEGREKWGKPERFRLKSVRVSDTPSPDLTGEATELELSSGRSVHVVFETENEAFPLHAAAHKRKDKMVPGVVMSDEKGRPWFFEYDAETMGTSEAPKPFKINSDTSPLVMAARSISGLEPLDLTSDAPVIGMFSMSGNHVVDLAGNGVSQEAFHEVFGASADDALSAMRSQLKDIVSREDRIANLVEDHLNPRKLSETIDTSYFRETGKLTPPYQEFKAAKAYNDSVAAAILPFMEALRAEGFCTPCPNNASRDVTEMTAWNAWLDGKFDGMDRSRADIDKVMLFDRLVTSPAFQVLGRKLLHAQFAAEKSAKKEGRDLGMDDLDEIFLEAFTAVRDSYAAETSADLMMSDLQSQSDGARLHLAGSFLQPVLGQYDNSGTLTVLPVVEPQKSVMHLTLDLPSQTLVMADTFRVDGFHAGLKALMGDDFYDINSDKGIDERARDMYEKTGLIIVQVGNTSPYAYEDALGVWRMGTVFEDDDHFWEEDGDEPTRPIPQPNWTTCTDLWANTFGDKEAVINVMMASGEYGSHEDATQALDEYIEEAYGASEVYMPTDQLHVYMPTGRGVHRGNFNDVFAAEEIEKRDWQEDAYILADRQLSVDPEILMNHDWEQLRIERAEPYGFEP